MGAHSSRVETTHKPLSRNRKHQKEWGHESGYRPSLGRLVSMFWSGNRQDCLHTIGLPFSGNTSSVPLLP